MLKNTIKRCFMHGVIFIASRPRLHRRINRVITQIGLYPILFNLYLKVSGRKRAHTLGTNLSFSALSPRGKEIYALLMAQDKNDAYKK